MIRLGQIRCEECDRAEFLAHLQGEQALLQQHLGGLDKPVWKDWTLDTWLPVHSSEHQREAMATVRATWKRHVNTGAPVMLFLFSYKDGDLADGITGRNTGKTGLAVSLAKLAAARGESVAVATTTDIMLRLQQSYRNEAEPEEDLLLGYASVDFLVIDDLGGEPLKIGGEKDNRIWWWSRLQAFLVPRYNEQRSTIITSAVDLRALSPRLGDQLFLQCAAMFPIPILVNGIDRKIPPDSLWGKSFKR